MRNDLERWGRALASVLLALAFVPPALLLPPGVTVYRVLLVAGELAALVAILATLVERRAARIALTVVVVLTALGTLAPLALTIALAPTLLVYGAVGAILAYAVLPGARRRRALAGFAIGGSLLAQTLLLSGAWLQISSEDVRSDAPEVCRRREVRRNGRRYQFAVNTSGTRAMSFFPNTSRTEIYDLTSDPPGAMQELTGIGPNRITRAPYRGQLLALEYSRGLMALDPDTLEVVVPPPETRADAYYMGLVIRRAHDELLVMYGDGRLSHLDATTHAEHSQIDLLEGEWTRFNEEMHSIYLAPDERVVVVIKNGGRVLLYDAVERRIIADRLFLEPTGNAVFLEGSEGRALIATMFSGRLQEVDLADLSTHRTFWLGPGFRYLRELSGDRVAAGNYLTGEVAIVSTRDGERIATVRVGPRIQWMETADAGATVWISHAAGLTALDVACLERERPREDHAGSALERRLSPGPLLRDLEAEGPLDATVWISVMWMAMFIVILGIAWRRPRTANRA